MSEQALTNQSNRFFGHTLIAQILGFFIVNIAFIVHDMYVEWPWILERFVYVIPMTLLAMYLGASGYGFIKSIFSPLVIGLAAIVTSAIIEVFYFPHLLP